MTFNIKHLIHFKPAGVQIFYLSEIDDCYADPIVIDIDQLARQLETDACAPCIHLYQLWGSTTP